MNTIHLIDQSDISMSHSAISLFVNKIHVIEYNEVEQIPIHNIANSLAQALGCEVTHYSITEMELAKSLTKSESQLKQLLEEIESGEIDYEKWICGYSNDDLITYINKQEQA